LFCSTFTLIFTITCLLAGYGLANATSLSVVGRTCIEALLLVPTILVMFSLCMFKLMAIKKVILRGCPVILLPFSFVLCVLCGAFLTFSIGQSLQVRDGKHFNNANPYLSASNYNGYNIYEYETGTIADASLGYKKTNLFVTRTPGDSSFKYCCVSPIVSSDYSGSPITFWAVALGQYSCQIPSCSGASCVGVNFGLSPSQSLTRQSIVQTIQEATSLHPSLNNSRSNIYVKIGRDLQQITDGYLDTIAICVGVGVGLTGLVFVCSACCYCLETKSKRHTGGENKKGAQATPEDKVNRCVNELTEIVVGKTEDKVDRCVNELPEIVVGNTV